MAKGKKIEDTKKEPVVYIIKNTGRGAVLRYTQKRFQKLESSLKASGWMLATKEQIEKAGFIVSEIQEEEPKVDKIKPEPNGKEEESTGLSDPI
jgi:hypothetical protein